jgi:Tfp pilus assembly protein PilF
VINRAEKRRKKKLSIKSTKKTKPKQARSTIPEEQTLTIQQAQAIDLAVQHQETGDLPKAESIYRQILQTAPNNPDALHLLGMIAHQVGKNENAFDLVSKALAIKPNFAEAHCNLGIVLKALGKPDEAVVSYNKALSINPDYAEAHSNLGNIFRELGDFDKAVMSYNKALTIKPDYTQAHSNLGVVFKDLGQIDEALASFNKAIAIKPDLAEVHNDIGIIHLQLDKPYEAVASFSKAIAIKSDYDEAYINLAKTKSYRLKHLFQQNEQSLFCDELDNLIRVGEINPIIGSLVSRSEIRYKTNYPNPFCKDPLKYVLQTDLIEQCDFENIFVKTAKKILISDMVSYRSQSLIANGYQTAGNLFNLEVEFMSEIKRIINSEIEKYRRSFKDNKEGFIKNWPTDFTLKGWLISMKSGGKLRPHMHEEGWISGSLYINVPPKSKSDSGNLVVCIDDEEDTTSENITPKISIDVVTGSLCLFPASLLHYTIPFESEEDRIVLAFDVIPK